MNIGYLDCFSGVSGNMLLGALLAAGYPEQSFRETVASLGVDGYRIEIEKVVRLGLQAVLVEVHVEEEQPHRHLQDIERILDNSFLAPEVVTASKKVFRRLAEAEAAVHGCRVESVHFHEVGAVDAMIDVVGTVAGLRVLGIDHLVCSPLPMTRGWVRCEHGDLPIPAPAVCKLLKNIPVYGEPLEQELVTPTGAALVAGLARSFGPMPTMTIDETGYGAGTLARSDGKPNLLRLITGTTVCVDESQQVMVLETNLDDWNPEFWPHVSARFMEQGALDVCLVPVHMKKGRPGFLLRVVCDPAHLINMRTLIFSETSGIGFRYRTEQRMTLPRKAVTVKTDYGDIRAKETMTEQGSVITPEYEACRRVACERKVPLMEVYRAVVRAAGVRSLPE